MMGNRDAHLSDQELVLASDGELAAARQHHLTTCPVCQARQQTLEDAAALVAAGLVAADTPLPSGASARMRLQARLADMAEQPAGRSFWFRSWPAAAAGALAVVCIVGVWTHPRRAFEAPSPRLTPGAALPVDREAVCNSTLPKNGAVPADLRQRVFQAYGIEGADPRKYEVDYLITPALGGAQDIRNLWPQPSGSALVKDELEDRLHDLVCGGQIDLAEAQRAISTDWVAAYKKYVETR